MYTLLILLIIFFIPIPVMMKHMLAGRNAYRGILEGSLTAVTGVTVIFIVFWAMTGATFFEVLNSMLSQISLKDMASSGYYMIGMKDLEPAKMQTVFEHVKDIMKLAVPGILIVFSMIVAYLNYATLSWFVGKTGRKIVSLPPFRMFSLPKSIVFGSLLIYVLAYLTILSGIIDKSLIMFNLEMLFTFIFSVQGLAVVFFFGYWKKIPKFVILIVSAIFVFTWLGETFLFMLGLTDIILDIRKRFYQTNLKV